MTPSIDNDKILRQIRAILAKAQEGSGATEAEAESALRFARRLMLNHNVDEADLAEKDPSAIAADAERVAYGQALAYAGGPRLANWESYLARAICELIGTLSFYRSSATQRRTASGTLAFNPKTGMPETTFAAVLYGPETDCADAVELFQTWSLTIVSLARMLYGGVYQGPGRSYAEGFATALIRMVSEIKKEERARIEAHRAGELEESDEGDEGSEAPCTALVLVNATALIEAKKAKGAEWLRDVAGIKLQKNSGTMGRHYDDAHNRGRADGSKANFSRNATKRLSQ
jgi:hypothetical protein